MNCLHITLTNCQHESRLLKHCESISKLHSIDKIYIAAMSAGHLESESQLDYAKLNRFALRTRRLSKGLAVQLLKYLEFVLRILKYYRSHQIGVVVIHSIALLPLGYVFKKIHKAKLIYDAHELETEKNGLSGIRKKLSKFLERLFIGSCDLTLVVSKSIENWYLKSYPSINILLVMNTPWYSLGEHRVESVRLKNQLGISHEAWLAIYVGSYSKGRCIEQLISAFGRSDKNFHICFIGYGTLEDTIQTAVLEHENIHILPAVSPADVVSLVKAADAGLCGVENTCLSYDFSMPNKLFEYLHAQVPIIAPALTEMKRFVEETEVGVVVEDFSSTAQVERAIAECVAARKKYSKNARLVSVEFSWQEQEKKLLSGYQRLGIN